MFDMFILLFPAILLGILFWAWLFPNELGMWFADFKHAFEGRSADLRSRQTGN